MSHWTNPKSSLSKIFCIKRSSLKGRLWRNFFSEIKFERCINFVENPTFTLPHLKDLVLFLSYALPTHLVLLSFFNLVLNFNIYWRRVGILTETLVIKISQSFENSVAMIANSVYTGTINICPLVGKLLSDTQFSRVVWKYERSICPKNGIGFGVVWKSWFYCYTRIYYINQSPLVDTFSRDKADYHQYPSKIWTESFFSV